VKDRAIRSGLTIDAPPEQVWAILADFPSYREWNPFIREISGDATAGARLRGRIALHTFRERVFRAVVVAATPGRDLRWRTRSRLPGLMRTEHGFLIEPSGQGCRFRQEETFSGFSLRFVGQELWMAMRTGFEEMNAALKRRAEGG
jgi:hypothetical protein